MEDLLKSQFCEICYDSVYLLCLLPYFVDYDILTNIINRTMTQQQKNTEFIGQKINGYLFQQFICSRKTGQVYKARNPQKEQVFIKIISKVKLRQDPTLFQLLINQKELLSKINNQNVIKFHEYFRTITHDFIVTQFCDGGSLEEYLKQKGKITEKEAIQFIRQILNGFKGIHEYNAMHRNLKISNIYLHQGLCKIADLGFATKNEESKQILGTLVTRSPQMVEGKIYRKQVDIWSIGVIFYQLIFGVYPFEAERTKQLQQKIKTAKLNFNSVQISEQTRDFITKCLIVDPKKRISWDQIYLHPIFKNQIGLASTNQITDISFKKFDQSQNKMILSNQFSQISKFSYFVEYEQKYLNQKNNIMFSSTYIIPLMRDLFIIKGLHFQALALFLKASYLQLLVLTYHLKKRTNIFKIKQLWESFIVSQEYQKVIKKIENDKHTIKINWQYYIIQFSSSRETIKVQNSLEVTQNKQFKQLVKSIAKQYCSYLINQLPNCSGGNKQKLIRLISSVKFFCTVEYPLASQFEKLLQQMNYQHLQKVILKK